MELESWFSSKQHFCSLQRTWVGFRASMWWLTPTVIPVPWDLAPSSGFYGHQACLWCTFTQASKISQRRAFEKREIQLSSGVRAWPTQTSGSIPPPHKGSEMWMKTGAMSGLFTEQERMAKAIQIPYGIWQLDFLFGCGVECVCAGKYYTISIHILMLQKPYGEGLLLTLPPFCIS